MIDADLPREADIARGSWRRGARLLSVPLGQASRSVSGLGRRLGGTDREVVAADLRSATAAQIFAVLGELKGGAMKMGQIMSLMEAAVPAEELPEYREQLRRLQQSAPPMPSRRVDAVLRATWGPQWREQFSEFSLRPSAAASIGQVHRARWADGGIECAVKIKYPGADEALRDDLAMMTRLAGIMQPVAGGMDIRAITRELRERMDEELDYLREAEAQEQAAEAFANDAQVMVPRVLAAAPDVIVSEWVSGQPLTAVESAEAAVRNRIGLAYVRFLFRSPAACGLLHADPHPGNFHVLDDGRIAVLDWGLAARMPGGLPAAMGRLLRAATTGDAAAMTQGLREEGFVTRDVDADALHAYLRPFVEPAQPGQFHFSREWLREQMQRIGQDKVSTRVVSALDLPPEYLLVHRVWLGGIAVLSALDVTANFRGVLDDFLPGWR